MATVGVSADRSTVRAVLLSNPAADEPPSAPLEEVEWEIGEATAAESIAAALEQLADRTRSLIENIALTYRTVEERRDIVTHLATGRWRTSSLVSVRAALLAYVREAAELDRFETILVLEVSDRDLTFILTDAARSRIIASAAWRAGPDPAAEALDRVRPALLAKGMALDAVVLCGAQGAAPELLDDFERVFEVPAVTVDERYTAAAVGAARIAAAQLPQDPGGEPTPAIATVERRRAGVALPLGAAAVAVLAASGIALSRGTDEATWTREAYQPAPPAAAPATPDTARPDPGPPTYIEGAQPPIAPAADAPANPVRPTPAEARPIDPGDPADPYDPNDPRPSETHPQIPTTTHHPDPAALGAPDDNGLFPGESPPPPPGSDPALISAWQANHLRLNQQWLLGG
ncbi:hypothetical protein SAMN04244553_0674 [Nocardia amikacinitolerans]|uniref:Uncharacterized protein n=1 Tax=Nocardia amikacinitolerans TaxID=756689 RepID=A0A285KUE8_9NOCA|nr:hypothetical protein [Nocardia amikacinitolerans]MCP2275844.1 hypothetical protein [Nocardia amikacinitolerans]MCP2294116.1 hypothetical protein [Nocardia amikacinitolerans]SNY76270.1 hypothetical protein SAMN04244553_0674 [Nocardia amikacinitolerans]